MLLLNFCYPHTLLYRSGRRTRQAMGTPGNLLSWHGLVDDDLLPDDGLRIEEQIFLGPDWEEYLFIVRVVQQNQLVQIVMY